ncbi:hypothetical protein ABQ366_12615 [Serratia fonticola]|uniref:hypothetical protein n=1 Tax=Serratia fonticola TaxID=47917 RepID=UPI003AAD820E
MSQFILIPVDIKSKGRINNLGFLSPINNVFLESVARSLNLHSQYRTIYTIKNIDSLCMSAQRDLAKGKNIKDTDLLLSLGSILKITNEFFMWYGNEYHDLDTVTMMNELIENITSSLKSGSGEIYIHYKP